jgi:hypothetical protein
MGTKYTGVSISGYNASPPSDLSTDTSSSNKVTWQKSLDKIGGPVKTALESINSNLVTFTNFGSRAITTTDSAAATDHMKTIEVASTVTVTFSLTLADAATMAAGYVVHLRNLSTVAITIARATGGDTIDGTAGNQTLPAGGSVTYKTNAAATGYYTVASTAPAHVNTTGVGNITTGEDDLITFSLPAHALSAAKKGVTITAWGTTANNANTKTLKLYFGAVMLTTVLTANQASVWRIRAEVISTGTDAQRYVSQLLQGGATSVIDVEQGTLTQDDGATITIKCTGEATSTDDVKQEGLIVSYLG